MTAMGVAPVSITLQPRLNSNGAIPEKSPDFGTGITTRSVTPHNHQSGFRHGTVCCQLAKCRRPIQPRLKNTANTWLLGDSGLPSRTASVLTSVQIKPMTVDQH